METEASVTATFTVQSCADSGAGSLRDILTTASTVSGSTVDMTHLTCSTISLDDGGIYFNQDDLTIIGPGRAALTIKPGTSTGTGLLVHRGSGNLTLTGLKLLNGKRYSAANGRVLGGCVYSHGNLKITDVEMNNCHVVAAGLYATLKGGCAYVSGNFSAQGSQLLNCSAYSTDRTQNVASFGGCLAVQGDVTIQASLLYGCSARDGGQVFTDNRVTLDHSTVTQGKSQLNTLGTAAGIYARAGLDCIYSTISHNRYARYGGGFTAVGPSTIDSCTIANNQAGAGAGIAMGNLISGQLTIVNSTISENISDRAGSAILTHGPVSIANSTITSNQTTNDTASGIEMDQPYPLNLESSIVAHNGELYGATPRDISGVSGVTIMGANNIVMNTALALPTGTIRLDPLLGPLSDNGGLTQTHALLRGSPAINAGSTAFPRSFDQRGAPHLRVLGAKQDIGAFESDPDQIFANRFE